MRAAKIDRIRATRRFGAFAVLTLRAIEKIRAGRMTASEAAVHFERVARTTAPYRGARGHCGDTEPAPRRNLRVRRWARRWRTKGRQFPRWSSLYVI
jgi:hypothetical protein